MTFTIRTITQADYPALSDVNMAVYGFYIPPDEMQDQVEGFPEHCKHACWLVETEGKVVAFGRYFQLAGRYHPQKFKLEILVDPAHQGRGIGRALYSTIMAAIKPFDPIGLNTTLREDHTQAIAFAERRGFVETMRTWEQKLLLEQFDPAPFSDAVAQAVAKGYTFAYLNELADDPEYLQKMHAMVMELRADVPSPAPPTPIPFDLWVERHVKRPNVWGWLVALKDGEYAGTTSLLTAEEEEEGMLHNGLTGVRRAHRGSGLSYALKVKALMDARAQGFKSVLTWNESNNRPMLAVNARLGFVRQPAWIDYNWDR